MELDSMLLDAQARIAELEAENKRLRALLGTAEEALAQLVDVLESEDLAAVFGALHYHGFNYHGPVADMDKARAAIAAIRDESEPHTLKQTLANATEAVKDWPYTFRAAEPPKGDDNG